MKYWTKLLVLVFAILLLGVVSVFGQEGGQGGIIIDANANSGTDVATMNPLLGNDVYSNIVTSRLFTTLLGIDPEQGVFAPGARNGLAESWDISEDGLTYTFHLRNDYVWSDGTPVTAADFLYSYNAIKSGDTTSPRSYAVATIESVEMPDDYTLVIKYVSAACNNLDNTNAIVPVPAHAWQAEIGDDYTQMDGASRNMAPDVSNGVFSFVELVPGQQVSLQANQSYPDALNGYVNPTGYIYKNVNTIDVALEQFLAGEVNLLDNQVGVPAQNYADLRARTESGEIQTYEELNNGYSWLAFNLSDPKNPVNGTDEDGNIVEQPPHPIFGDVRVRKALAQAADLDAIIQGVLFGEAVRATSPAIPTSWAYNPDLPAVAYDPDAAAAMLEEAGWIDEDGDGVREAHGAMYAADGTPLTFTIVVSASESEQVATAQILQDQFKAVGANAEVQAIDFNTAVQQLVGQVFDTALLGWSLTYPDDPDFSFAFNPENDIVGGGFNFVSYNNSEVSDLLNQANNLPGCDPAGRAALYQQAQELLVDDQPYIFMTTKKNMIAAAGNIEGFSPYPNQMFWNVDTWAIAGS